MGRASNTKIQSKLVSIVYKLKNKLSACVVLFHSHHSSPWVVWLDNSQGLEELLRCTSLVRNGP